MSTPIQQTALLMNPEEVLRRYLQPSAYEYYGDSAYIDRDNLAFLRSRMAACGNPAFRVLARAGSR